MEKDYLHEMIEQAVLFERNGHPDLAQNIYTVRARLLLSRGAIAYRLHNTQGAFDDLAAAMQADPEWARSLKGDFSKFYEEGCRCQDSL